MKPLNYTYGGEDFYGYMGNYWDNYTGTDGNGDGIGDTPYQTSYVYDPYPLITQSKNYFAPPAQFDTVPPTIGEPVISPEKPGTYVDVKVSVNITDDVEVENATLWYRVDQGSWVNVAMTYNSTSGMWEATIPGQPSEANVEYYVEAYDKAGNRAETQKYSYTVGGRPSPALKLFRLEFVVPVAAAVVVVVVLAVKKRGMLT